MATWSLAYDGFDPDLQRLREALCTLSNGYFATRGAVPEARSDGVHYPGTYVAGLYNRLQTTIAGRTVENEDLVNVPNWLPLSFRIAGGEWFDPANADLLSHRQELDIRRGVLTRHVRWQDADGRRTRLSQRRLVYMRDMHLAALETTFEAENWAGELEVRSGLDGGVVNAGVQRYSALNNRHLVIIRAGASGAEAVELEVETSQSSVRIAQAARTRVLRDGARVAAPRALINADGYVGHALTIDLAEGRPVTVEKIVTLYTSRDRAISESLVDARLAVMRAESFQVLFARHARVWNRLWNRFDIRLDSAHEQAEPALHLHIFHLLQTVSPNTIDLDVGVPARGWHGEAYRGHIFWDELFIFPFLNFQRPVLSRALLMYRHRRLGAARWAARAAGYEGAMYPWQSGSNGREETQTLHLNPRSGRWLPDHSHLQRHVNIAVAYNIWQHYQVTGNMEFLRFYGAEMLIEISRFWASIASYNVGLDRYEIYGVMGPDEYHDAYPDRDIPGIDNNAYTNVMAAWVLLRALETLELMPDNYREEVFEELGLSAEEVASWRDIAAKMYVPFHDGIIGQFDGYERLKEFDWAAYREKYGNIQRLDRLLEAEGDSANRYQVSKQADVLMLLYLLSADELRGVLSGLGYELSQDQLRRTITYYLERTSQGSTLSRVVHAWVLSRFDSSDAWRLLLEALDSDIADVQGGTTAEGIHLGAMAGTVDIVQRCLGGLEVRRDVLWFNPALPPEVPRLRFSVHYRGHRLQIDITDERIHVIGRPGPTSPITLGFRGMTCQLQPGETAEFLMKPPP
ncbi:MAG TPA: glycosyl hydrolase family 65 protein [Streptosporangiaceae bacterium]|nr:glycosyl hydrolase family 65 protein [Streptosporangiaceae bacterium]